MRTGSILLLLLIGLNTLKSQQRHYDAAVTMKNNGLSELRAFELLHDLTSNVGHRLSGSVGYEKAVEWSVRQLKAAGADSVWTEPVMVPKWVRGNIESAHAVVGSKKYELTVCALGGSVGTPVNGVAGEVLEVQSFDQLKKLGDGARGKIIFYNRPFDKTHFNVGQAYGGSVNQRTQGAIEAAKVGAVGILVRSMTNAIDDEPHTGMMRYLDSIPKIPAAAISTLDANALSNLIASNSKVTVTIRLSASDQGEVLSYNVIGEIKGSEYPREIVLVGGHLDSWDKGTGAHDDGSGVVHSIEAIRLIRSLGETPKRTVRAVLFANEENGLKGARAYAARESNKKEKHIAAIESDAGGFQPRGFGVSTDSVRFEKISSYKGLLELVGAEKFTKGGGGADISVLTADNTVLIGVNPESQRYFDYHHSNHDTIDKVHPRELELGGIAVAILAWALAQDGI